MDVLAAVRCPAHHMPRLGAWARFTFAVLAGCTWGHGEVTAVAPLMFASFWHARSRAEAWRVVTAYYVAAYRPLVVGGAAFLAISPTAAWGMLACGAGALASVWVVFHSGAGPRPWAKHFAATVLLLLVTLSPPVAIASVAHPIAVAGLWFPNLGLIGLLSMAVLIAAMRSFRWGVVPGVVVAMLAALRPMGPSDKGFARALEAVQTRTQPRRVDVGDFEQHWYQAQAAMRVVRARPQASILVLPEGSVGLWSAVMAEQWETTETLLRARGQTALVGTVLGGLQEPLWAGVVALGASNGVYRQRVSMPLAMWRPGNSAFQPTWFGPGTIRVGGVRLGMLVCWEVGVTWAALGSMLEGADALVGVANVAWLPKAVQVAQADQLRWWGRLFGVPVALAFNAR